MRPPWPSSDSTTCGFIFKEREEWREVSMGRGTLDGRRGALPCSEIMEGAQCLG